MTYTESMWRKTQNKQTKYSQAKNEYYSQYLIAEQAQDNKRYIFDTDQRIL
jgi:hypothetical protein